MLYFALPNFVVYSDNILYADPTGLRFSNYRFCLIIIWEN